MGRKVKFNTVKQFGLSFRGEEEVKILEDALEKAKKFNIPLKAIILMALKKLASGSISYEEFSTGKYSIVIQKKETTTGGKKGKYDFIKDENYNQEWVKNLKEKNADLADKSKTKK